MENWIPLVLRNILMKDAMKGVFPSSEPKAPVRTEAGHTLFYFVFFVFGRWGLCLVWPCPSVYLKCIQRKRFYVALVFSTAHPAYGAQRSERVAFLGRI